MFKILSVLLIVSLILITNSAGLASSISINLEKTLESSDKKSWTFIIYLDADNNLENAAKKAFNLLELTGSNKNISIVVQFDSLNLFKGVRRYYVTYDVSSDINSDLIEILDEKNMGSPDTLIDFVNWAYVNYPADRYCLILYDHGNGWRSGFLTDETNNDYLSMYELKNRYEPYKTKHSTEHRYTPL